MGIATFLISFFNAIMTGFNYHTIYEKYKYDSYAKLKEKRIEEIQDASIEYAALISRYNYVRCTLWEQRNNTQKSFNTSDINAISDKKEKTKQKILFLLDNSEDSKRSKEALKVIEDEIFHLPDLLKPNTIDRAFHELDEPTEKFLNTQKSI